MQACIVVEKYNEERDEFGIVKFGEFTRLDSTFDYLLVPVKHKSKKFKGIYVKCPRCGRVGRLVVAKNRKLTGRTYAIIHRPDRRLVTNQRCSIGVLNDAYEFLNEIYEKCRLNKDVKDGVDDGKVKVYNREG